MAISREVAQALLQRLELGHSVLDEHGDEVPVKLVRDRKGRDKRKPPRDFANVPALDVLMRDWRQDTESSGRGLSTVIAEAQRENAADYARQRERDERALPASPLPQLPLAVGSFVATREPGEEG